MRVAELPALMAPAHLRDLDPREADWSLPSTWPWSRPGRPYAPTGRARGLAVLLPADALREMIGRDVC